MFQHRYDEPTGSDIRRAKAHAIGGARPRCRKGKACSASCISSYKFCLVTAIESVSEGLKNLRDKIRLPQGKPKEKKFLDKLKSEGDLRGSHISRKGENIFLSKKVGSRYIDFLVGERGTSFSFSIDGSFDRPKNLSKQEGIALLREIGRMTKAVVSTMKPGSVISVSAWDEDERGLKLSKLYEKFGFSPLRKGSLVLYGKVNEKGELVGSTLKEYSDFLSNGPFNFSERLSALRDTMGRVNSNSVQ